MWMVLLLAPPATADAPALDACCQAAGVTDCPETIFALGQESMQISSPGGASVSGAWALSCVSGPAWDGAFHGTSSQSATTGTVLGALSPEAAACFDASCRLPEGTCLKSSGSSVHLGSCNGAPLRGDAAFVAPLREARGAVVIGSHVVGGEEPAVAAPKPAVVDPTVPDAPTLPCRPATSLRLAANEQVDAGNEAVVDDDLAEALDHYRAALTMDACNALAWAALGDALLSAGYPKEARTALDLATQLMPTHAHAWTRLGEAFEADGDRQAALTAYQKALAEDPGNGPATQGLLRLQ
jgi:hypothetical protein